MICINVHFQHNFGQIMTINTLHAVFSSFWTLHLVIISRLEYTHSIYIHYSNIFDLCDGFLASLLLHTIFAALIYILVLAWLSIILISLEQWMSLKTQWQVKETSYQQREPMCFFPTVFFFFSFHKQSLRQVIINDPFWC